MTISYDILFRVTVHHAFYNNGVSADFDFIPSPATQRRLDAAGLVFRSSGHGFLVLARVEPGSNPPKMLHPVYQKSLRLSFLMVSRNQYFNNFTKFPGNKIPRPGAEVLYFSNAGMPAANAPQIGDQIGSSYLQLLNRKVLNLRYNTPVNQSHPVIEDMFGETYGPVPGINLPPGETTDELQIDFSKLKYINPGRYRISDANLPGDIHLWYEPELNGQPVFAIVDIFSDTDSFVNPASIQVAPAYKYLNNDLLNRLNGAIVADYEIHFDVSAYELRYLVQLKPETLGTYTANDLLINLFNTTVHSADRATFVSNTLINWSEVSQEFKLEKKPPNTLNIKSLPNPAIFHPVKKRINPNPPNDEILYYDLNIYV